MTNFRQRLLFDTLKHIRFAYREHETLFGRLSELEEKQQEQLAIILDWETRSRLAQALNDAFVQNLASQEPYARLKVRGYGFLPYMLSAWAVFHGKEPVNRFLEDINEDQYIRYGGQLEQLGLADAADAVWDAIPALARNVMITMWLTRPPFPPSIAHSPTVDQGRRIIDLDPHLSADEKDLAKTFIPMAVDKRNQPFFTAVTSVTSLLPPLLRKHASASQVHLPRLMTTSSVVGDSLCFSSYR